MSGALRRITLCADDYGISPGVNAGIRELIERGRLNATSVMVVGPAIGRDDVSALQAAVAANPNCAIGLHATLTAPFHPLTMHYRPLLDGLFLPLGKMLRAGLLRRLDRDMIQAELTAQIAKFAALFGRPARLHRRSPARPDLPAGARCVSRSREGACARCVGQAIRPHPAAVTTAQHAEGSLA